MDGGVKRRHDGLCGCREGFCPSIPFACRLGGNDHDGLGPGKIVGQGQVDDGAMAGRRHAFEMTSGAPVQHYRRPPRRLVDHAHVAPVGALAKTGAQRLGAGFLGGEALGIGGRALGASLRFALLNLGEHALNEALTEAFEGLLDAADVDDVVADAENHALLSARRRGGGGVACADSLPPPA